MFSSLRMHGGSNHYFVPTGILLRFFSDVNKYSPETSVFGEVFGGGVVRIDSSNSSHLTGPFGVRYPGELLAHTPESVMMLKNSGHSGRQASSLNVTLR